MQVSWMMSLRAPAWATMTQTAWAAKRLTRGRQGPPGESCGAMMMLSQVGSRRTATTCWLRLAAAGGWQRSHLAVHSAAACDADAAEDDDEGEEEGEDEDEEAAGVSSDSEESDDEMLDVERKAQALDADRQGTC